MASVFKRGKRPHFTYSVSFHRLDKQRRYSYCVGPDRLTAKALAKRIDCLKSVRISGDPIGHDLAQWLERLPSALRAKLVEANLLDGHKAAAGTPMDQHLAQFGSSLQAKGTTTRQIHQVIGRAQQILNTAGTKGLTDINASKVESALTTIANEGKRKLTSRTKGFYLASIKQFCTWAVRNGTMNTNPVKHLSVKFAGDVKKRR